MTPRERAALERKHDGPIPPGASVPADANEPSHVQTTNRRKYAWEEVRRYGHLIVHARQMWNETHSVVFRCEIVRLRGNLRVALERWAFWRKEDRALRSHLDTMKAVGDAILGEK